MRRIASPLVALVVAGCSSGGGTSPRAELPDMQCRSDGDCAEEPGTPYCFNATCVQCRAPHHCAAVAAGADCVDHACVVTGGGDAGLDGGAEDTGQPFQPFCGPVEERPYPEPDDRREVTWGQGTCSPPCTGHNVCYEGLCKSRCEMSLACPAGAPGDDGGAVRLQELPDGTPFSIGAYEASLPDADEWQEGCNRYGRACSQPMAMPRYEVTWDQAQDACTRAGMRLCTLEEWHAACRGACDFDYPYGNDYTGGACNDLAAAIGDRGPTGKREECSTPEWIYDLVGNLREWTSTEIEPGKYAVVGGTFSTASHLQLGCSMDPGRLDAFAPSTRKTDLGFRCCRSVR